MSTQPDINQLMQIEIERRISIISAAYERASNYSNLIILAGYAGTFTLWSLTKDYLSESTVMLSAILLGFSLFIFCAWEVFKMIYTAFGFKKKISILIKGLPPQQFFQELEKTDRKVQKEQASLYRFWYVALILSVPTGFGAGLLLFYNYIVNLIKIICA